MFKRAACFIFLVHVRGVVTAAFVLALTFGTAAQQTSPYDLPYATITYPSSDPTTAPVSVFTPGSESGFALVGLQPGQAVQVVVQYPREFALKLVNIEALDGGTVLPPTAAPIPAPTIAPTCSINCPPQEAPSTSLNGSITVNGTLSFTYVATQASGRNAVSLRIGTAEMGLQFWVLDPQDPQSSPIAITPSNPYPADTSD